MSMTVTLHPAAGCSIEEAARGAIRVATILGLIVRFDFNGVKCSVGGSETAGEVVEMQQVAQRLGYEHIGQAKAIPPAKRAAVLALQGNVSAARALVESPDA